MKFSIFNNIKVNDAGTCGSAFPNAFFRFFQQVAIEHSDSVGLTHEKYDKMNKIWILHRLHYKLKEKPMLYDSLRIETWSRGLQRFKGFRDYVIYKGEKPICTASSIWLFIDTQKKRPVKVDHEIENRYISVDETTNGTEIETWQPVTPSENASTAFIELRQTDFDINKHVNNTVYPNLVYEAFVRISGEKKFFTEFCIEYSTELAYGATEVEVKIEQKDGLYIFSVSNKGVKNALGFFSF